MTAAGFLGTWYFAKVLEPGVLGTYFLALGVLAWISTAGDLGIQSAITKRVSEGAERSEFLTAGLLLQASILGVAVVLMIVFWGPISVYMGFDGLLLFAGLFVVKTGFELVRAILRGEQKVHVSSILISVERVSRVAIQVGLLVVGYELFGLFVGYVAATVFAALVGIAYISIGVVRPQIRHIRSLLDFSKYSWLNSLRGRAYHGMDTIVLGFFVAQSMIAVYGIAWNISTVFSIFGDAIQVSFFPEISASGEDRERIAGYVNDALAFAGLLTIPGVVGSVVVGDAVLRIYGTFFAQGYAVLVVLAVANLFSVYESQFLVTLNGIDRPDLAYRVYWAFLVANLVLNVVLVWQIGVIGAAYGTTIATVVSTLVAYWQVRKVVSVTLPYREVGQQTFAAVVMGVVVVLGRGAAPGGLVTTVALVGVGAAVYFLVLFTLSSRLRTTVRANLPAIR
jgi:O-antigen/teichoic acid export membrane protein